MDAGKTSLKGWGNASIISTSSDFPYSSYSYDLFSTMQEALLLNFSEDFVVPDGFWDDLTGNYNSDGARNINLYRIISVVTPGSSN